MTTESFEEHYAEYIAAVPIDKDDLDNEVIQQPELYRTVSDKLALLTAERDTAKRQLERLEAEIDQEIRDDATTAKVKITEAEIKRRIAIDSRVVRAANRLATVTLEVSRLGALKESIAMRKDMFKVLAQLHNDQYWSRSASASSRDAPRDRVREAIRGKKE